jgi:uncharacterized membrane protein
MRLSRQFGYVLKFLHILGAIGFIGAIASLLVLLRMAAPLSSPVQYTPIYGAMAEIATWVLYPSMVVTVIAGLLAIAASRAFHNAGWAWVKLATGILVFEGSLISIIGPIQEQAKRSAAVLAGQADLAMIAGFDENERLSLWILLVVALANVVLGIWRPRLTRIPD